MEGAFPREFGRRPFYEHFGAKEAFGRRMLLQNRWRIVFSEHSHIQPAMVRRDMTGSVCRSCQEDLLRRVSCETAWDRIRSEKEILRYEENLSASSSFKSREFCLSRERAPCKLKTEAFESFQSLPRIVLTWCIQGSCRELKCKDSIARPVRTGRPFEWKAIRNNERPS